MKILITFNKMATVYKYAACLQRLCRLHFANIFYRRKVCTGWFSTHLLFLFHQTKVLRKHRWTEDQKWKTDWKRAMLGHLRGNPECFPSSHAFSGRDIFHPASNYEDQSASKGNFFIKIHLSCNFSVRKYVGFFFHQTSPSPFPHLKGKLQQRVLAGSLFGSVICQMWGRVLASLYALM